jgi:hypothetical protein
MYSESLFLNCIRGPRFLLRQVRARTVPAGEIARDKALCCWQFLGQAEMNTRGHLGERIDLN